MGDIGSHRSVSQCLYYRAKELENSDGEKIDTWVITVKGVGGVWRGEGAGAWLPGVRREDEKNLNNPIKHAASHSLISID